MSGFLTALTGANNAYRKEQEAKRFQDVLMQQKQAAQDLQNQVAQSQIAENNARADALRNPAPQFQVVAREDGTYLVDTKTGKEIKTTLPGVPKPDPVKNAVAIAQATKGIPTYADLHPKPQAYHPSTREEYIENLQAANAAKSQGGAPSVDERKNAGFHERAQGAAPIIDKLGGGIAGANAMSQARRIGDVTSAMSPEQQQFEQASRQFVSSVLRKDTGASISKEEWNDARRIWIPEWRDSPEVLEQKRVARQEAIRELELGGGRAVKQPSSPATPTNQGHPVDRPGDINLGGTKSPAVSDEEFNAILGKYKK